MADKWRNALQAVSITVATEGQPTDLQTVLDGIGATAEPPEVADSTAADVGGLVSDFNGLLAVLRDRGILAPASEE